MTMTIIGILIIINFTVIIIIICLNNVTHKYMAFHLAWCYSLLTYTAMHQITVAQPYFFSGLVF